jgi:hypothetical protein
LSQIRVKEASQRIVLLWSRRLDSVQIAVRKFVTGIQRDFAEQIAADPRDFKQQILRLVRRELPPKRGRPASPQIDAAIQLLRAGKSVRDVLRLQIPGFDELDAYGRYLAEKGLRQGLARRGRNAEYRKSKPSPQDRSSLLES